MITRVAAVDDKAVGAVDDDTSMDAAHPDALPNTTCVSPARQAEFEEPSAWGAPMRMSEYPSPLKSPLDTDQPE
eukprot:CAMPEP_0174915170 /NCGR_PEP_ID=MMETSP1355-20121228/615_1 /TAXON_ID=464990 /ORGANISM="Hemiselmis tepida, Strain CCMP443" /LENGTH=73 /DNA_ID=CAMNT_0016160009 /DNA_START=15 /DNA_END=237 /DNA_ORIENTATION=-